MIRLLKRLELRLTAYLCDNKAQVCARASQRALSEGDVATARHWADEHVAALERASEARAWLRSRS